MGKPDEKSISKPLKENRTSLENPKATASKSESSTSSTYSEVQSTALPVNTLGFRLTAEFKDGINPELQASVHFVIY